MKIAIMSKVGSEFDLSDKMYEKLIEMGIEYCGTNTANKHDSDAPFIGDGTTYLGKYWSNFHKHQFRTNPILIKVIEESEESEELGLKVVEIPFGINWKIEEQEMGNEIVREVSRSWY